MAAANPLRKFENRPFLKSRACRLLSPAFATKEVLHGFHPPEMDIRIFESKVLSAITGIEYDVERLWEAGERIWNLRRAIMVRRENRERKDDAVGHLWFERTISGGQSLAAPLDRKQWDEAIPRYHELRGWNPQSGRPARAKLEALGMKNIADKLG
jgi:aldehyde:ferredoxin oxidoreductase